jgi:hypothetical protein
MLKKVGPFGFSNASTGGHSARSMMFLELRILVRAMPLTASKDDFTKTIVEENVLEKPTLSSRKKSLRHLIELYGMDPSETLFRVLWQLGHADLDSLPQLCLVCAYARDLQLRRVAQVTRGVPHTSAFFCGCVGAACAKTLVDGGKISVTNAKYIGLRRVTAISTHSVRVQTHTSQTTRCVGHPNDYLGHPPAEVGRFAKLHREGRAYQLAGTPIAPAIDLTLPTSF